jgi:hypothetical protein
MDLWSFERDGVQEAVTVGGWLVTSNAHRDTAMDLALSGEGVVRALDWTSQTSCGAREASRIGRCDQVFEGAKLVHATS